MTHTKFVLVFISIVLFFISTGFAKETAEPTRLVVTGLVAGGAGEKAGIKADDVFVKYDGKIVSTRDELNEYKNQVKEDSVEIAVLREDKEITFKIPKGSIGAYMKELLPDIKYKQAINAGKP